MRDESPYQSDFLSQEERDQFYGLNAYAPAPDPRRCAHQITRELPGVIGERLAICLRCGAMVPVKDQP